jgi:hypothetical protein
VVTFASLLATDGSAINLFAPFPACVQCNFGIANWDCSGSFASARASGKSGHLRYASTKFCSAAK